MSERSEQLEALEREFEQARTRMREAAAPFDDATWTRRPAPDRWSAAECVVHLSLTSAAFLPVMRQAVGDASGDARREPKKWRAGFFGGLFAKLMEPPVMLRAKTTQPFMPAADQPRDALLEEFEDLQSQLTALLHDAANLDMSKIRVQSVFSAHVHYNLYACFKIVTSHQRRHIWQMEQVHRALAETAQRGG